MRGSRWVCIVAGAWIGVTCGLAFGVEPGDELPDIRTALFPTPHVLALDATPDGFELDGAVDEWSGATALQSPRRDGDSVGGVLRVWLAAHANGVVLAGVLPRDGDPSLRITVASVPHVTWPPIGWKERWTYARYYTQARDCTTDHPADVRYAPAECEAWFAEQVRHRERLARQFLRTFDLRAGSGLTEEPVEDAGDVLRPTAKPQIASSHDTTGPRGFEVLIPWDALPATDALVLQTVYLRIEDCTASSTAGEAANCGDGNVRPIDDEPAFLALALPRPRTYFVTPCRYELLGDVSEGFGSPKPGYFLPGVDLDVRDVMSLQTPSAAYQDRPQGLSPTPGTIRYQSEQLGDDEYVCGPRLAYRNGSTTLTSDVDWYRPGTYVTLPIDGDNLLVRSGPLERDSRSGMGYCGACPRAALGLWYLDRSNRTLTTALRVEDVIDGFEDGASIAMTLSDDWRTVTKEYDRCGYENGAEDATHDASELVEHCERTRTRYCLPPGERTYAECGTERTELPSTGR